MPFPRHQRAHGTAELGFAQTPRGTVLRHLFHAAPLRVLFPTPEPGEAPMAALVNVGGGLAGGDSLEMRVTLGDAAVAGGCGVNLVGLVEFAHAAHAFEQEGNEHELVFTRDFAVELPKILGVLRAQVGGNLHAGEHDFGGG